jgi:hypothetical protein
MSNILTFHLSSDFIKISYDVNIYRQIVIQSKRVWRYSEIIAIKLQETKEN